ncbi:MAG: hypothetical protein B7Z75_10650 [Acidocella sp. 20-57-95]|nr:MAG: hypothetical protein B7Z75_10650 [Acidocella sp. 20-57-95]OYV57825.1 MAG: hypothetical protein B7Z71_11990 [Acidocella sp. 21-58-7]HQT65468.1 hypothetical protein [Acidocella sp.]HQU05068.1 hypothetical protein [Acidocella sp.]
MNILQPPRYAAIHVIAIIGLALAGCTAQTAPPQPAAAPVAAAVPPNADAVHKAFEAGYSAGYAVGKRVQARIDAQIRDQLAASTPLPPSAKLPSDNAPVNAADISPPVTPQTVFQPTGQAVPVPATN